MMLWLRRRSREVKENDTKRGSYVPVNGPYSGLNQRPTVRRNVWKLAPIVALLGAAILMVIHHIFNAHLNEKRIDPGSTELPSLLQSQRNVNIIETTIAHGARILLSMTTGATFAQVFWETLRSRSFTVAQVDALVRCGQSPFHPSTLRAATASFTLFIVSLIASATSLIVVLSPGSLTINSEFQRSKSCAVPTVPPKVTASDYYVVRDTSPISDFLVRSIMTSVVETNSYFPPLQASLSSTCGGEITTCSYNITFFGPALVCIDITNETDFTTFLTSTGDPPNQAFSIFNSTLNDGSVLGITILSRDMEKNSLQANNCTTYNASYDVGVNLHQDSATVEVRDVTTQGLGLDNVASSFLSEYGTYAISNLLLSCLAGPDIPSNCSAFPFFDVTSSGNNTFSDTVPHFVTSFVQNITLSLLSGSIDYGYSNDTATNLQYVQSTCSSVVAVYVYNPTRLFATYGLAVAVTTLVTAYGCYLILCNDVEREFVFSRLASVALNEDMLSLNRDSEKRVHGRTFMQLFRIDCTRQKLVLVSPNKNGSSTAPVKYGINAFLSALTTYRSKMLLLVLSAAGCMILNHAYYQYLDGKGPNSSLRLSISSEWTLNQTIVSDIGIALAYAGQTLLAVAIGTSCVQVFWHVIRHQGHTVYEVDSLIKAQTSPFSFSLLSALRASLGVSLLSLLAASMSFVSIFAPGAIKVASDHNQFQDCTVLAPRNLSSLTINLTLYDSLGGNSGPLTSVASLGTYLAPINTCISGPSTSCSYDIELVGPGFDCEDVTESRNNTAFATSSGIDITKLYFGDILPQNATNQWQISVQTWDVKLSVYQKIICTGVLRSYTVATSHTTDSALSVTKSRIISSIHGNMNQPVFFTEGYLSDMMRFFNQTILFDLDTVWMEAMILAPSEGHGIGAIQLDGNVTWSQNMSHALEDFAQNATLSILSGLVLTLDPDVPDILENVTTTCAYTFPAYEYSPHHLFLTYGVGIIVTILCVLWGSVAIRQNGVEESMDFSRFLQGVLNERMYDAREILDKDTIIKADETTEGSFAPMESDS